MRANLRKREKTDGLFGLKTGGRVDQPMGKRETNVLVGAKNRGPGQPKEKRENEWNSRG